MANRWLRFNPFAIPAACLACVLAATPLRADDGPAAMSPARRPHAPRNPAGDPNLKMPPRIPELLESEPPSPAAFDPPTPRGPSDAPTKDRDDRQAWLVETTVEDPSDHNVSPETRLDVPREWDSGAADIPAPVVGGSAGGAIDASPTVDDSRPPLLFQPAVPGRNAEGMAILRPRVRVADGSGAEVLPSPPPAEPSPRLPSQIEPPGQSPGQPTARPPGAFPSAPRAERSAERRAEPFFSELSPGIRQVSRERFASLLRRTRRWLAPRRGFDAGVGAERLRFALFEIDAAQPNNHYRLRFESGYDWEFPDRAEFFWSKLGGKGPPATVPAESSVDYQELRLLMEFGGDKFSAATELPLRFVDPTVLSNTGGFGDMVLTTKTVMFRGDRLQLTQVLRNQLNTGSAQKGRGNGHVSMEPGFVASYERSAADMLHSELKLWFPIGGDPDHSGPVLRYGFGYARLWVDRDTYAVIPTFECVAWSVLTGGQTVPGPLISAPQVVGIDGINIVNFYPGLRFVRDAGGDLGLFEIGLNAGLSVSQNHWYETMVRLDLRWMF